MSNKQLSKKAHKELSEKLKYLKGVKRKAISKAIGEASAHGDLKENSSYHEAKKDQGLNEMRIAELERNLSNVKIISDKAVSKDSVVMSSKVKIKNMKTKDVLEYTIVSEGEADIFEYKISDSSPLGVALLNHEVNDIVEFIAPVGVMKYKIVKIS